MEVPTDIDSVHLGTIPVDEMVEVEYIEVEEQELMTLDTVVSSSYFDTVAEANNCSLFSSKPKDDVSSDEEKEGEPKEASDNRVPAKNRRSSWKRRFTTESAQLDYNRQKASMQGIRREKLAEGFANLRAAVGTTEPEYKSSKKLLNHVLNIIPLAERHNACQKYIISCLVQENAILEEKIKKLELERHLHVIVLIVRMNQKTALKNLIIYNLPNFNFNGI